MAAVAEVMGGYVRRHGPDRCERCAARQTRAFFVTFTGASARAVGVLSAPAPLTKAQVEELKRKFTAAVEERKDGRFA